MTIHRILGPATLALAMFAAAPLLADPLPIIDSTGSVRGRAVLAPDHRPAAYANVVVLGTGRGALADEQGRFVVRLVPLGSHTLFVAVIGARPLRPQIDVVPGENDIGDIVIEHPDAFDPDSVAIGSQAAVRPDDLEATIRPAKPRYRIGDTPEFRVRIRNRGAASVFLVQSVDDSDWWASPRVNIGIEGPSGGFVVPVLVRCGNNNGVSAADIAKVGPGKEFDPYAGGWLDARLRGGRFTKPGRYTATFRYVTTETDARRWMAGPCSNCDLPEILRDLLVQVPAVELTATTEFEIVP